MFALVLPPQTGSIFFIAILLAFSLFHSCGSVKQNSSATAPPQRIPTSYYLDCSAAANGTGTQSSPWNTLANANTAFIPGDHLLLKRGTTCNGTLAPQGSGFATAPIVIDAYGSGPAAIINGGAAEEVLKLFNQQYWEINNLEIVGGRKYGVYISGDTPNSSLNHIYLKNLDAHGATFNSTKRADSGEVFLSTSGTGEVFNDVLIDGVVAHDTHASEGIFVSAGGGWTYDATGKQTLGDKITVQNSIAHDVYGDGIVINELTNGLLQSDIVYRSGQCPDCTGSTPVGLWEWFCHTCTVQFNESYANSSWEGDGGDFDIDYYNNDNIVQYNYGHDSAGYCVAFFGSAGTAHRNIFRYNVCANNARRASLSGQGEIFVYTWNDGSLDGVQIYNNTISWNPAGEGYVLSAAGASYTGSSPLFFRNNIIYAAAPGLVQASASLILDNNLYYTTTGTQNFEINANTYTSLAAYQSATGEDAHSQQADPLLTTPTYHDVGKPTTAFHLFAGSPAIAAGANVCANISGCARGAQDFWGNALPSSGPYNIGAYQGPR
jgi:hypothetical protein